MKLFSLGSISRNLTFLIIIAVLPALAILIYTGVEQRNASIENSQKELRLLTSSMAEVQRDFAKSCQQLLATLALLPEIRALESEASSQILAAVLKKNPDLLNIALTDAAGNLIASGKSFKKHNISDRAHFQSALRLKRFVAGEYIVARLGEKAQAFPFAYPVQNEHEEVIGVLNTAVDLNRLTAFHAAARMPENSFIAATDRNGIRLFFYPPKATNPIGQPIKSGPWELAKNAEEPGSFVREGSDSTNRMLYFHPLRLNPAEEPYMYIWTGVPEQEIVQPANARLLRNLALLFLATALAVSCAWLIGRKRLIVPINKLLDMTNKIAAGELNLAAQKEPLPAEFDRLITAFHDMANALENGREALLLNEARFRIVMDSVDALVYVADMESYEILFINQYGRNVFGDITGKICWQSLQVGQTGPCPFCTNDYLLDENGRPGEIYTWEFQNTATGNWYFIHDRAIEWIDGRVVRLEIATDISERKQAEAKLAEETERLAVTLKSIGDGVISCDTEGRVLLLNRIAEEMTGWTREDAIGRPLHEVFNVINENSGQPIEDPIKRILSSGEIVGLPDQNLLITKEGNNKNISDSCAPIRDEGGQIVGAVLVFRDITERLRTEQELLKVKKLESIGVLAGGIAHDFNNILAAILGNLDLSLRDKGMSDATHRRLKQAQTASFRARDLTQQLLTFAKGGQPIKETASLAEVVQESAEFVLRGDKVACRFAFPDNLNLVDIDKGQISQVVQNIILNASHAMPDGGIIDISGENVPAAKLNNPALLPAESYVKLVIKDTGSGIPEQLLDKIFDPYFTTKQEGSGLGLAITHSIISKHGGAVTAHSKPGNGSSFTIYLPASGKNKAAHEKNQEPALTKKQARILVMDDEEIVRKIAEEMLNEIGHEVLFATNGSEAVARYREALAGGQPIDLLLMDLTIPGGLGGKEALEQIQSFDKNAKAIVSSGYSNDPIMANYSAYGFAAAIAKPYQLSELTNVINQLLA